MRSFPERHCSHICRFMVWNLFISSKAMNQNSESAFIRIGLRYWRTNKNRISVKKSSLGLNPMLGFLLISYVKMRCCPVLKRKVYNTKPEWTRKLSQEVLAYFGQRFWRYAFSRMTQKKNDTSSETSPEIYKYVYLFTSYMQGVCTVVYLHCLCWGIGTLNVFSNLYCHY